MQTKGNDHKCSQGVLASRFKSFRCIVMSLAMFVSALSFVVAQAEPVSVNSPAGQGFAFSHNGNCFVMLPTHVHGSGTALSLSAGSPATFGAANVMRAFADMDLSIATVTGGLDGRCTYQFDAFPENVDDVIALDGSITLLNVSETGRVDRLGGRVTSIGYDALTFELDGDARIHQGRSGSIILAGDKPIGMLIDVLETGEGYALRIDAIGERIGRLLNRRGQFSRDSLDPEKPGETPENSAEIVVGLSGLGATLEACSDNAASPEANCWAFASGTAPLLIDPRTLPFSIDLSLADHGGLVLQQVLLQASADAAATTTPKSIIVLRSTGSKDRPAWASFGQADMSPQGQFEVSNGAGVRTRAVRIIILDSWFGDDGQPVRLDSIQLR